LTHRHSEVVASTPARWRIVAAGFLLALMGGFSYAWGVVVLPVMELFGWTKTQATLPFTTFMLVFAVMMVPAGRLHDRYGPRVVSAAGAVLFFVAYAGAALVGVLPHSGWLVATYGVIGGSACALTYACIAPPARKWFPDKPALAVSTAVMGFGLAALVVAPIKSEYLLVVHGIENTFLIIGVLAGLVCLGASRMLVDPPAGWSPPGWTPPTATCEAAQARPELTPCQTWRTHEFRLIWAAFGAVICGGLLSIALIPAYGSSIGLSATESAFAISVFAVFNGFGRPLGGYLADRHGVLPVMFMTYAVQCLVLLTFPIFATSAATLYAACALLGWGFAVSLGLFPVLTSQAFGVKHLGGNYGLVFSAFGVAALAPLAASRLYELTASHAPAFIAAGMLAATGLYLCQRIRRRLALGGT